MTFHCVQGMGDPSLTVSVEEIYQLEKGPLPEGLQADPEVLVLEPG